MEEKSPFKVEKAEEEATIYPTKKSSEIYDKSIQKFDLTQLPVYTEYELQAAATSSTDFFKKNNFLLMPQQVLERSNLRSLAKSVEDEQMYPLRRQAEIPQTLRKGALSERVLVGVKLGKLYIEYGMGGKGSFELSVTLLDFKNKKIKPLIKHFSHGRFGNLAFDNLVPFFSLYNATRIGSNPPSPETLAKANVIKKIITDLALEKNVSEKEITNAFTDLFGQTLKDSQPQEIKPQTQTFFQKVTKKNQKNEHSLKDITVIADKLYKIYLEETEITKEDLIKVFEQYQDEKKKEINNKLVDAVLNTEVEHERKIPLKAFSDIKSAKEFKGILFYEDEPEYVQPKNLMTGIPSDLNSKQRVIEAFINSKTSSYDEIESMENEQALIKKVKKELRESITKSLDKSYNIVADSSFGQSIGETLGLPVKNTKYMRLILPLVAKEKHYDSLQEFSNAIDHYINKIKPFGTNVFLNKAKENQQLIHQALAEKTHEEKKGCNK